VELPSANSRPDSTAADWKQCRWSNRFQRH